MIRPGLRVCNQVRDEIERGRVTRKARCLQRFVADGNMFERGGGETKMGQGQEPLMGSHRSLSGYCAAGQCPRTQMPHWLSQLRIV
jgi:hypothetical protein